MAVKDVAFCGPQIQTFEPVDKQAKSVELKQILKGQSYEFFTLFYNYANCIINLI